MAVQEEDGCKHAVTNGHCERRVRLVAKHRGQRGTAEREREKPDKQQDDVEENGQERKRFKQAPERAVEAKLLHNGNLLHSRVHVVVVVVPRCKVKRVLLLLLHLGLGKHLLKFRVSIFLTIKAVVIVAVLVVVIVRCCKRKGPPGISLLPVLNVFPLIVIIAIIVIIIVVVVVAATTIPSACVQPMTTLLRLLLLFTLWCSVLLLLLLLLKSRSQKWCQRLPSPTRVSTVRSLAISIVGIGIPQRLTTRQQRPIETTLLLLPPVPQAVPPTTATASSTIIIVVVVIVVVVVVVVFVVLFGAANGG